MMKAAALVLVAMLGMQAGVLGAELEVDRTKLADKFWGLGGVSGGGATSRLLVDYKEPQRSQLLCVAVEHPVEQGRIGNDLAQIHVVAEGGTAGLPERTKQQAADIEEVDHQLPEFGADRFQRLA